MTRAFALGTALACCVSLVGLGAGRAVAQSDYRSLDVSTFEPTPDAMGFLSLPSSRMPGPGGWNVGLWLQWVRSPLAVQVPDGATVDLISQRATAFLQTQLGVGERLAVALSWPLVLSQSGQVAFVDEAGGALDAVAAGDPHVQLRFRLHGERVSSRREVPEGLGLALLAGARLPLGTEGAFAGEPGARWDLGLLGDFHVLGFGIGGRLGMRFRGKERRLGRSVFGDALHYGLALKAPLPLGDGELRVRALAELRGVVGIASGADASTNPLVADLGLAVDVGDASVWSSVGTGLLAGAGAPVVRAVVGVQWRPRERDRDGDGLTDDLDQCPFLPEDLDGFEDEDGCLDPDDDLDGIEDADDACPREAADPEQDADGDGCPDPDRDGDGIADARDRCPEQPGEVDGCPREPEPAAAERVSVEEGEAAEGAGDAEREAPGEEGGQGAASEPEREAPGEGGGRGAVEDDASSSSPAGAGDASPGADSREPPKTSGDPSSGESTPK